MWVGGMISTAFFVVAPVFAALSVLDLAGVWSLTASVFLCIKVLCAVAAAKGVFSFATVVHYVRFDSPREEAAGARWRALQEGEDPMIERHRVLRAQAELDDTIARAAATRKVGNVEAPEAFRSQRQPS